MADADPFGLLGSHLAEVTVSGLLQWPTPASPQDPLLGLVPQSTTAAFKKGLSSEEWSEDKKDFISARLASSGESIPASETGKPGGGGELNRRYFASATLRPLQSNYSSLLPHIGMLSIGQTL